MPYGRRRNTIGQRRKLIWARSMGLLIDTVPIPAAGTAVDLLAQFRADGGSSLGATVTRVRLDLSMVWIGDQNLASSITSQLALGLIVDQIQPNQAEVPRPGVEEHADWMYWRRIGSAPASTALPVIATAAISYASSLEIDVRSQRKVEELGQTLWFVADPTYTGATSVNINCNASVLLKLP